MGTLPRNPVVGINPETSEDIPPTPGAPDALSDGETRFIWLTAMGKDDEEIAGERAETRDQVAQRYRSLLNRLGLDDRLSLVLAAIARSAPAPHR